MKSTHGIEERPILPSIHTLDLPFLSRPTNVTYRQNNNNNDNNSQLFYPIMTSHHSRRISTSSSCTTISRNSSPFPSSESDFDSSSETTSSSSDAPTKFRLEPCSSLDEADAAVIFIPPPEVAHPGLQSQHSNYVSRECKGKGLLLVGPALQQVRHPQRPLAKGARIHPYRIVRPSPRPKTNKSVRRSSIISVTGFSV